MGRSAATFKQADITRAVKAARACGLAVVRTEIASDGRIILVHHADTATMPTDDFGAWKAKRDARSA